MPDILDKAEYHHSTLLRLEEYLKEGGEMPSIKYWSGTESFSDYVGHHRANTLAESIELYLDNEAVVAGTLMDM